MFSSNASLCITSKTRCMSEIVLQKYSNQNKDSHIPDTLYKKYVNVKKFFEKFVKAEDMHIQITQLQTQLKLLI